ncbi:hypothetical protein [Rhodococcus sp. NCIMB 12038]|uniref:hypothetical protein n=1 Tax=Rhodococcus sp. NCIMB 12038 TaxID=933800 RepID=UPI000B3C88D8|nr:hypothetical protein [Rhodococcus sp. NCIMB 12038]OUS97403.1 hypothetical protein CA951_03415 [Rhodococcus sp. NCIMB 12038]
MWRYLAPLMAARRSMRLAAPGDNGKFATSRTLTRRLPGAPAAVPLYNQHGRTVLLALDFDVGTHGVAQVDTDVERVLSWLHECGGRAVTDRSTSGGRHVLVPLPTDTPLRVDDLRVLLALLEERLPTFDKSPMLGSSHGCVSVPGSLCRGDGHRQLDGSLAAAVEAFTLRSDRGLVARLVALLGGAGARHPRHRTAVAVVETSLACEERLVGVGDARRLHPRYCRTTPIPADVDTFARTGVITDSSRWPTPSEARQSVICHAVLRGSAATDIEVALGTMPYAGLRNAYARYGSPTAIADALRRDVAKALIWAANVAPQFRELTHENRHTGGRGGGKVRETTEFRHERTRLCWLAKSQEWIDREFLSSRQRPILLAVVQALAYSSALAGELVEGVPVVAVGGRSLSHAAGLMSESTVWAALRLLRDTPGSPVLRVARGAGQLADRYALTTPAGASEPDEVALGRAHVEPVHQAWSVLGLRGRTLYDLVRSGRVTTAADAFAAAQLGQSAGYAILTDLRVAGLITLDKGSLSVGHRTLDDVADDAGLEVVAAERVARHRAERLLWHTWLECRFGPPPTDRDTVDQRDAALAAAIASSPVLDVQDSELIWAATMAAGPPPVDPADLDRNQDLEAFDLLSDILGAVLVHEPS